MGQAGATIPAARPANRCRGFIATTIGAQTVMGKFYPCPRRFSKRGGWPAGPYAATKDSTLEPPAAALLHNVRPETERRLRIQIRTRHQGGAVFHTGHRPHRKDVDGAHFSPFLGEEEENLF